LAALDAAAIARGIVTEAEVREMDAELAAQSPRAEIRRLKREAEAAPEIRMTQRERIDF